MNNEPVAWMQVSAIDGTPMKASLVQTWDDDIPLYTHPHPDNLGLAESIIKQQELRIAELEKLVDELAGYKESYENCHRMCNGYGMN
jgi:hypothetical protein